MKNVFSAIIVLSLSNKASAQVGTADVKIGVQTEPSGAPSVTGVKWLKDALPDIDIGNLFIGNDFKAKSVLFQRNGTGPVKIAEHDSNFIIGGEKTILGYDKDSETLSIGAPTQINTAFSLAKGPTSNSLPEWSLFSLNTFEKGSGGGLWRPNDTSTCGENPDTFLGGHCKFAATRADGIYVHLPMHSEVKVTARVHFFDQWEGQSVFLKQGNTIVWTKSWSWCPKKFSQECAKKGIDTCGHSYPDRISVPLEITFKHIFPLLTLSFDSTLPNDTDPCTVSWGVDDIAIYVR